MRRGGWLLGMLQRPLWRAGSWVEQLRDLEGAHGGCRRAGGSGRACLRLTSGAINGEGRSWLENQQRARSNGDAWHGMAWHGGATE